MIPFLHIVAGRGLVRVGGNAGMDVESRVARCTAPSHYPSTRATITAAITSSPIATTA